MLKAPETLDLYDRKEVSMQISEFLPQPNSAFKHPRQVASRLGKFFVELKPDRGAPDDQMLLLVEELMADFQSAKDQLEQSVYEEYQDAARDKDWMVHCGVPTGLSLSDLAPYILERVLVVYRYQTGYGEETDSEPEYLRQVYLRPKWDEARSLFFEYHRGQWNRLDF